MAVVSVERIRGMDLYDATGQRLGNIRDVIFDLDDGSVRYALVGTGDLLSTVGIRDRWFVIPFSWITVLEQRVRLEARWDVLKDAPSFSVYQFPEFTREYERQLHNFWDVRPYWEESAYRLAERQVSDLMARDVPIVGPDTPVCEAAATLLRNGNVAVAVVDERGQYLGIVTAQHLAEVATEGVAGRRHEEEQRLGVGRETPYQGEQVAERPEVPERRAAPERPPGQRPEARPRVRDEYPD